MKNLVSKLVRIMTATKRVAKNGENKFHNYSYVTEADVLEAVRENLAKENVFIFSSVAASHREGDVTSVQMKHTFVDGDSGESFEVFSLGQGQDKGDKGGNKAVTAAVKYFLMKNLLIPTGDDPEATDETGKSTGGVKAKPTVINMEVKSETSEKAAPAKKTYGFSGKPKLDTTAKTDGGAGGFGS